MGTGIEDRLAESAFCGRARVARVAVERQAGGQRKTWKQGDPIWDQNVRWICQEHRARLGREPRDTAKNKAGK